ncbi:preprotein translocase subunit SecY [Patescibacteria group bacterium]|nr:MAG: preprotein translocase subunit SecY [Patescibacteria group bacterium]
MKNLITKISLILKDPILKKRILFTVLIMILFRVLAAVPIPGIDTVALERLISGNQFLGLLNLFSGGGLSSFSLIMLGVGPYITGSIIMQLLTMMSPKLKAMYQEEGEAGRAKFSQYSRLLAIPLGIVQAFSFLLLLQSQGVIVHLTTFDLIVNVMVVTAGSILLMWVGELITEFGIGNGVSLIIFAGIVAGLPSALSRLALKFTDASQLPIYALGFVVAVIIIVCVVVVTEAERPIPITYAKRVRGNKVYGGVSTYLPLRVNQAGVIPIIFALSILLFPQMILNFVARVSSAGVAAVISKITSILAPDGVLYAVLYFILVFLFTYFYTAVTFDPNSIATNLQKNGAFIPGVRPGESTSAYIAKILTRLTLVGALFLGFIAVLPLIMTAVTGIRELAIGGTALLIVVSVVLDLMKKIDAQVSMREY